MPRRPSEQRRGGLVRLLVYALVVPWLVVCLRETRNPEAYFAGLALLIFGVGLLLGRRRPRWTRTTAARAANLLAFSLLVLFLFLELGVRAWVAVGEAPPWLGMAPDPVRYRLDPGREWLGHKPNSRGFFDEEFAPVAPKGSRRIASIGDSFTVGIVPYEENYLTLVDEALGPGVDVLNLGVVHTAVPEYLEILRSEGLPLQPDLVLLGFYIGNDIRRETPRGLLSTMGSKALLAARVLYKVATRGSPFEQARMTENLFGTAPDGTRTELAVMDEQEHRDREWKHLEELFRPPEGDVEEEWADTEASLRDLVALCRRRGLPLVATLAPDEIQVDDALLERVVAEHGVSARDFDLLYPNRRLLGVFEELDVPVLDLLPALRAAEATAHTYHPRAVHWNRHGNAAVAAALTPWLREQLEALVPEAPAPP